MASRSRLQPYSRADAPYFRSPGFYVRVGGLALAVALGVSLLALRAWSLQVLHGKEYAAQAQQQAYRTVDLIGARGAIVDSRGRLLAGTTGHVVIDADAGSLGTRDAHGRFHPSAAGRKRDRAASRGSPEFARGRSSRGSSTTSSRRPSRRLS